MTVWLCYPEVLTPAAAGAMARLAEPARTCEEVLAALAAARTVAQVDVLVLDVIHAAEAASAAGETGVLQAMARTVAARRTEIRDPRRKDHHDQP